MTFFFMFSFKTILFIIFTQNVCFLRISNFCSNYTRASQIHITLIPLWKVRPNFKYNICFRLFKKFKTIFNKYCFCDLAEWYCPIWNQNLFTIQLNVFSKLLVCNWKKIGSFKKRKTFWIKMINKIWFRRKHEKLRDYHHYGISSEASNVGIVAFEVLKDFFRSHKIQFWCQYDSCNICWNRSKK